MLFNKDQVDLYLKNCDTEERRFVRAILDETKYITLDEFISNVEKLENLILSHLKRDFYVYLPVKHGSEQWMLSLVTRITSHPLYKGTFTNLNEIDYVNNDIILIDDVVYSGCNIQSHLDSLIYSYIHPKLIMPRVKILI